MGIKEILQIKGYVIKLVSIYPRTIAEIRKKLIAKDYFAEDIDQAIRELSEKKYLDDEQYAKDWIDKRIKYRPCGKLLCKSLLLKRGLEENIIDQALSENYSDEKERALAKAIAQKKSDYIFKNNKYSKAIQKKKLAYSLNNKGFPAEIIMEIIK